MTHQRERVVAVVAARESDVATQREPLTREEAEAEQHERQAGPPAGLHAAPGAEAVPSHQVSKVAPTKCGWNL